MDTSKPLQVLQPKYRVDECLAAIKECLDVGWTGLGFKTTQFEEAWKQYTSLPHAHFLSSATAGLHLAIRILKDIYKWEEGVDEIITTPLTFVSTNHAIMYEGLVPVFAAVDPNTLCLSPESVERMISSRTKAVLYVGLGGRVGHLDEIRAICKKNGLKLILDAAHMAGTKRLTIIPCPPNMGLKADRTHIGQEADVTVFSFQSVKNLPTADGGMICFQDAELDARARKMSWLGIDKDTYARSGAQGSYKWRYDVPYVGFKYHGNSIMAAIGLVQLRYLDTDNDYRRELAVRYTEALKDGFFLPRDVHLVESSCHLFQLGVPREQRDEYVVELNRRSIFPGVHYVLNTEYVMYRNAICDSVELDGGRGFVTLPLHLNMTVDDVDRVIEAVKEIQYVLRTKAQ